LIYKTQNLVFISYNPLLLLELDQNAFEQNNHFQWQFVISQILKWNFAGKCSCFHSKVLLF